MLQNPRLTAGLKILSLATLAVPVLCFANITVSPMKVILNDQHAAALVISSKSETTQYIQGKINEVHNPGTPEENETPAPQGTSNSLVVSPLKFGLPAGNNQPVRIVGLGESNEEKIYRVHFQSLTPEEFKNTGSNKNFTSDLSLTIVWGVVVMVPPAKQIAKLGWDASAQEITNTGNIHLLVNRIGLCASDKPEAKCQWKVLKKNVYPGKPFPPSLSFPGSVSSENVRIEYFNDYTQRQETENYPLR
ncbi:fimbria/pilus periplasmic chaperone [Rahnella sp. C60]|uniref:fimbria/pilus periplasmic chaperone n=1 Tax=Rahnella perminowiae TaxID=2816244 RepID=UPI001C2731B0|nr:fimbria/pilus periplasmic chaperone [Rahnella perminowiae]MBU9810349.1 fimbria/pilus periplasmic chaperone [Rahnella perminowiae]MBU9813739.1 fimbria/pilus periplasmic chaperone [Rahnella perminowiae]